MPPKFASIAAGCLHNAEPPPYFEPHPTAPMSAGVEPAVWKPPPSIFIGATGPEKTSSLFRDTRIMDALTGNWRTGIVAIVSLGTM